jgi:hypothetical protein
VSGLGVFQVRPLRVEDPRHQLDYMQIRSKNTDLHAVKLVPGVFNSMRLNLKRCDMPPRRGMWGCLSDICFVVRGIDPPN